ncbi:MAG TPA: zf-HC2 domain-containing protein [Planctomycetota bacterium]|nr:zf-HC2 domain-containing protein [Planctomycetota bacterium]
MNCDEIRERLPALIDGELEASELAEVEKHLAGCTECRTEKTRQEKFTTSVKVSLEGLRPSDRFIKQVIEKLPESDAPAREAEAAVTRRRNTVSLVVALAIIALAVAVIVFRMSRRAGRDGQGGKPPAGTSVPVPPPAPAPAPAPSSGRP